MNAVQTKRVICWRHLALNVALVVTMSALAGLAMRILALPLELSALVAVCTCVLALFVGNDRWPMFRPPNDVPRTIRLTRR
jgi:hypothetical protein